MKKHVLIVGWLLLAAEIMIVQESGFARLAGPYLGQKPPGMTPEVFAPGIVSKEGIQARLFVAPDGSEIIYWEREPVHNRDRLISIRNEGGVWSEPAVLPFSERYINNEPSLSPDGKKLFFVSNRPRSGQGEGEKFPDIWMVEKVGGQWGEPKDIGEPVNRLDITLFPFLSVEEKLYFGGMAADRSSRGLYVSQYSGGRFGEPEKLDGDIFGEASSPCVSPDNRTMIVHSSKSGGWGSADLYASFKTATGAWGPLINLGPAVNTEAAEAGASFSPDGQFLFFSRAGDVYWVSAKILEELKPK